MATVGNLVLNIKSNASQLIKDLNKSKKGMQGFKKSSIESGKALGRMTVSAGKAAVALAAVGAAYSVKAAVEYQTALAEVSTLLEDTSGLETMSAGINQLSAEFGMMPTDQVKASYQIISAGANGAAEALNTLQVSNKLAVGGVTDVLTAADGLTSVMNAYASAGLTATEISDSMFVAMKAGKTTIGELASGIGLVAPIAAKVGVEFDQLTAATAAITKGGVTTKIALNGLRAMMIAVLKPAGDAEKVAKGLKIDFTAAGLASKGFAGFMEDVMIKTKGSTEAMTALFGNVEALAPALMITANNGEEFNKILEAQKNKLGETEKAAEKMGKTSQFQMNQMRAKAEIAAVGFGTILLPTLNTLVGAFLEAGKAGGGLSVFESALFNIRMASVAVVDSLLGVFEMAVKISRYNPVTGLWLLMTDKDEQMIATLKGMRDQLQMTGTAIGVEKLELEKAKVESAAAAKAMLDLADGNETAREKVELNSTSLADLGLNMDETAKKAKALKSVFEDATDTLKDDDSNDSSSYGAAAQIFDETRTAAEAYAIELQKLNVLREDGFITQDTYNRALETAKKDYDEAAKAADGLNDIGKDLGFTFSSAFEDAVIGGENFRDVLSGIFDDIARIILRKAVTEPISDAIAGFDFKGFFGGGATFATGTPFVPETGLATVHKGERIIPANENKQSFMGRGGGDVNISITVDANGGSRTQGDTTKAELTVFARTITGLVNTEIQKQKRAGGQLENV